jgi:hypothetical protein
MVLGLLLYWYQPYRYLAVFLFVFGFGCTFIEEWFAAANHSWLALWTLAPAVLYREWWQSQAYQLYLRYTLAVVMFAAAAQKLLAGTYLDGSYIAWLSYYGGATEQAFRFLCSATTLETPCVPYIAIGTFIVIWQVAVGAALLFNVRHIAILFVEFGFLLGAGLYADELNFQVLNVALLCIIFRFGMPLWLLGICLVSLMLDLVGLDTLLLYLLWK